jgi:hypothetical protein
MATKTDRILSTLPSTFRALPQPNSLYSVADAFGSELLAAENSLAALMLAHWVDHADRNAEWIQDLACIAALYGLTPRGALPAADCPRGRPCCPPLPAEEGVEEFRAHLKRYVRTFLDGTVTVQGILRVAAEVLGLSIADGYAEMDAWWRRATDRLITVRPRGEDAASLLFGREAADVKGEAAQPARILGRVELASAVDLSEGATLRLSLDGGAQLDIDLAGLSAPDQIVQAINAKASGAAGLSGGRLELRSPTAGAGSRLEVAEIAEDAAPRLLGLLPHRYRGSAASRAQVAGRPDLSAGVDLSAERYLRLLIDGRHLAEVDCAARAADPDHPVAVTLAQLVQAINEALSLEVAAHDGSHLIMRSPTSGFDSSIAFQPAAVQDARERLFGAVEAFTAGLDARPAAAVGINDLGNGVDLSLRSKLRVTLDERPPVTVSVAGTDPAHTLISEITAALTAKLGLGIASHDGRFLRLTSPTAGPAGAIEFELLPPQEDATEILFGIAPRLFSGADAAGARLDGAPDLSAGADLSARHALRIAVDGAAAVEVDARSEALDPRKVTPQEIVQAINKALNREVAAEDGRHIVLRSPVAGEGSRVVLEPLAVTLRRRFVTRAFGADEAAKAVLGVYSAEAHGSAASGARVVGKNDLSRGVDLRAARTLRIAIDRAPAVEIDCAGSRPRATTIAEAAGRIGAALGPSVVSHDGRRLILSSPSTGSGSRIAFEPTRAADAAGLLLGLAPGSFRGRAASRVTFVGVADLAAGVDLPPGAAVKLGVDRQVHEIPLAEAAPVRKSLTEVVIAVNLAFGRTVALHDGRHLILTSLNDGSASRLEFLAPSGTDSTQVLFGVGAPRAYQGADALPAALTGRELAAGTDLGVTRFLNLAVNGAAPIAVDCAAAAADPRQATPAEVAAAVNAAFAAAQVPAAAALQGTRLVLQTADAGAASRIELLAYTAGDARAVLFGDVPDAAAGSDAAPAVITGDVDLLSASDLSERRLLRVAVDGGRPQDVDIAGAAPATTFLDEIVERINSAVPGLASATDDNRLRLRSPTAGEASRLTVLPLRALELIDYPPAPAEDPPAEEPPRLVRPGDPWSVENDSAADGDLRIVLNAPQGVFGPGFVNRAAGLSIRLMRVLSAGERLELWREPPDAVRAAIVKADGAREYVPAEMVRVEDAAARQGCGGGAPDKAAALVLPQGRSQWAYLACQGARFDRVRFDAARFAGGSCAAPGIFDASRFTCPPPRTECAVFASAGGAPEPAVEVRFLWDRHAPGAFTVNLPADLPERFGGRFNQARFARAGDQPEVFAGVVSEPAGDPDFVVDRIAASALVSARQVDRVPIGFTAAMIPFRKPRRLSGGADTAPARLYLAETDVDGFIELSAREAGAWGNAIAVAAPKSGPGRFDLAISYQAARFENARQAVLGGDALPALTEDLLKPSPVGILQAKAGGVLARVTREGAESDH